MKLLLGFLASFLLWKCCLSVTGPFRRMFSPIKHFHAPENVTGPPLFLTPLIKAGNISQAQHLAFVHPEDLGLRRNVKSFSGYLTVGDPKCNSNLFFWFFPAFYNPETAPVLLWLQGGPGGTSLFGLFNEHGPFLVRRDLASLKLRHHTWATNHNLIYIDNPVGTGYSFTDKDECYAKNQDDVANDLYNALQQFFTLFPDLRANDFYASGESYAGKYVPAISYKIHTMNSAIKDKDQVINLKGMAIGDGLCDPVSMTGYGDFLFGIGLIDEDDRDYFKKVAQLEIDFINHKQWFQAFQVFDDLLNGDLSGHQSYFTNVTGFTNYFNYLLPTLPKDMDYFQTFVQKSNIRRAIHVGNLTFNDGTTVEKHLLNDVMQSVKPWIETLIEKNYKVLIYNGQLDVIIAWPLTENFIRSLTWSGAENYLKAQRTVWHVESDIAGYSKNVANFTVVLVRNAGHMVPYDQPKWSSDMINRFTRGKAFN